MKQMMIKFPQLNNFLTCPALLKLEGRVTKHTNLIARWNLHQCIDKLNINLLKLKKDAFQKEILKRETLWGKKLACGCRKGNRITHRSRRSCGWQTRNTFWKLWISAVKKHHIVNIQNSMKIKKPLIFLKEMTLIDWLIKSLLIN